MPTPSERKYAQDTTVSVEKTIEEIKKHLGRFGATGFMQAEVPEQVALMFILNYKQEDERRIKFVMKSADFDAFEKTSLGKSRNSSQQQAAYDKERKRLWRALAAGVKGKLIMVEDGIESIEEAFYANVVLPSGRTVYEETRTAVGEAYKRGLMPSVPLLALPEKKD